MLLKVKRLFLLQYKILAEFRIEIIKKSSGFLEYLAGEDTISNNLGENYLGNKKIVEY